MRLGKRVGLVLALAVLLGLFFTFDLGRFLSLAAVKGSQADLQAWRAAQPLGAALLFFAVYVAATAVSLPGATVLTLAAGALFGLGWGTLIVSFASTLGATLAFLAARWLFGGWVQARFADRLTALNAGIAKEGGIAPLAGYFPRVAGAFLIGRDAPAFAATLSQYHVAHETVETLDRAVPAALKAARTSGVDVVLLSPACASFDQFSGFEARGARFRSLVSLQASQRQGVV